MPVAIEPLVIGGVGQLYQGDLDLGRIAADRLAAEDLGGDVIVEDFFYGAVAVAQRLQELRPRALVLIGAVPAGGDPGEVRRRLVTGADLDPVRAQRSVGDAITGYVGIDLVLEVAAALEALPAKTVAVEVEPGAVAPSERLSQAAAAGLEAALQVVRAEIDTLRNDEKISPTRWGLPGFRRAGCTCP